MKKFLPAVLFLIMTNQSFAMSNPSAIFCNDIARGKVVTVTTEMNGDGSQSGICFFNTTSFIKGWTLLAASKLDTSGNRKKREKTEATISLLKGLSCSKASGKIVRYYELSGKKTIRVFDLCEFSDGSGISVNALNEGPKSPVNADILSLIQ